MSSLGPELSRPILCLLCSPPSIPTHVSSPSLPPNRGLERALEEASSSGVLNLSSRKLKEFPQTAANHDLSDTVEAGRGSGERGKEHISRGFDADAVSNWYGIDSRKDFSGHLPAPAHGSAHLPPRTGVSVQLPDGIVVPAVEFLLSPIPVNREQSSFRRSCCPFQ